MGVFDFLDEEKREKSKKFKKGKELYYHDPEKGIAMMKDNAQTEADFKLTASKRWEFVKDKSGREKAFADSDYKELMASAANAD